MLIARFCHSLKTFFTIIKRKIINIMKCNLNNSILICSSIALVSAWYQNLALIQHKVQIFLKTNPKIKVNLTTHNTLVIDVI